MLCLVFEVLYVIAHRCKRAAVDKRYKAVRHWHKRRGRIAFRTDSKVVNTFERRTDLSLTPPTSLPCITSIQLKPTLLKSPKPIEPDSRHNERGNQFERYVRDPLRLDRLKTMLTFRVHSWPGRLSDRQLVLGGKIARKHMFYRSYLA